jgi:hypothetical protein
MRGGAVMTVQITRLEHDAGALRRRHGVSEAAVARRILSLALVLERYSCAEAAKSCGGRFCCIFGLPDRSGQALP